MKTFRAFVVLMPLILAACQVPQPTISDSDDSAVRVQYNGGEQRDAVFATAKAGCATYSKQAVLIGTRCLESICVNKEAVFRCE